MKSSIAIGRPADRNAYKRSIIANPTFSDQLHPVSAGEPNAPFPRASLIKAV